MFLQIDNKISRAISPWPLMDKTQRWGLVRSSLIWTRAPWLQNKIIWIFQINYLRWKRGSAAINQPIQILDLRKAKVGPQVFMDDRRWVIIWRSRSSSFVSPMANTEAPTDSKNKTSKKTHSIGTTPSLKVEDRGLMIQTYTGKPWTKKTH